MNPGPVEEAGKVAATTVEALKQTPLMLALVIFNIIFIVGVYFSNQNERSSTERIMGLLIKEEADMSRMLNACIPPSTQPGR